MIYTYTCNHCIEALSGKSVRELPVQEYCNLAARVAVAVDHQPSETPEVQCGNCNSKMRRTLGVQATFIRGYGFLDKRGAKNDMNLYQMVSGNDPYKEHRKEGEKGELENKLRRNKEYNPRSRRVFMQ